MSTPTLNEVRALAKRHGLDRCVVFYTLPDGRIGYTSYGATRALCQDTRQMADRMYDAAIGHFTTTSTEG